MKLASLLSGGKDSTYALYTALKLGHEVKFLITMVPERADSWMFHYPCVELTKLQAESLGIKQITKKTKGEKEKELEDLKKVLEEINDEIDGVVSGAIASEYQKSRIDKICKELGLEQFAPLWGKDQEEVLKEELKNGFKIIFTGVFADGFDESWLGRKIDEKCIEDLVELNKKYGINICGEGGEFETLVLDCPIFKKKIKINEFERIWDNKTSSGYIKIKSAELIGK